MTTWTPYFREGDFGDTEYTTSLPAVCVSQWNQLGFLIAEHILQIAPESPKSSLPKMRFFNIPMINLFGFLTSTYCASPTPKIVVRIVDNKLLAKQANRGIKSFHTLILDKYAALIKGEMCVSRTTNYVLFISRLRVLPSQILMLNLGLFVKISFLGNVSISTHLELRGLQVTSMLIYQ